MQIRVTSAGTVEGREGTAPMMVILINNRESREQAAPIQSCCTMPIDHAAPDESATEQIPGFSLFPAHDAKLSGQTRGM